MDCLRILVAIREMKKYFFYVLLVAGFSVMAWQQGPPFESEIRKFREADSISFPPKGAVLFVGSSSIRMWKTLEEDFPRHKVINRGFGGSSLEDVDRYKDQVIFPYKPRQVVIYCGENDIASGASATVVFERFEKLFTSIRTALPRVSIVFISMKPSPSRIRYHEELKKANQLISDFMKTRKRALYVDIFSLMLDKDGRPMEDLFVEDRLHMNDKGYVIWRNALEPVLR